MNRETRTRSSQILFPVILLLTLVGVQVRAQSPTSQSQVGPAPAQTQPNQPGPLADLAPLDLKPDQIQRIRSIQAELKDQRQAAGMKLRQARRTLAEAVESPTPNEALIEQRSHEVADAQATTIRLNSLAEARIRQVLTPEQRIKLREMRQQNQTSRREANQTQLPGNLMRQRQQKLRRNANMSNQRKAAQPQSKP